MAPPPAAARTGEARLKHREEFFALTAGGCVRFDAIGLRSLPFSRSLEHLRQELAKAPHRFFLNLTSASPPLHQFVCRGCPRSSAGVLGSSC